MSGSVLGTGREKDEQRINLQGRNILVYDVQRYKVLKAQRVPPERRNQRCQGKICKLAGPWRASRVLMEEGNFEYG